jgi:hypothetical protein
VKDEYFASLKYVGSTSLAKALGRRIAKAVPSGVQQIMSFNLLVERTFISCREKRCR